MKNTTFRKKALLSSVAMLLVALVALGSATFAWFTASTTTTADGLMVKTIQASELVISKSDRAWGQVIDYDQDDETLRPVSSADGVAWYAGTAENKSGYAIKDGDTFTDVSGEAGYFFVEELNIANKGAAAVNQVTITIKNFTNNYGRIALVPVTASGAAISGQTFAGNVYDTEKEDYSAVSGTAKTAVTSISPSNSKSISVGTLDGKVGDAELGGAVYYKLYVWFEGQDTDCYDTNAGQSIGDIEFEISGKTAE